MAEQEAGETRQHAAAELALLLAGLDHWHVGRQQVAAGRLAVEVRRREPEDRPQDEQSQRQQEMRQTAAEHHRVAQHHLPDHSAEVGVLLGVDDEVTAGDQVVEELHRPLAADEGLGLVEV